MNIFILDEDPILAAQQQCDKHVVKMVLESGQMLSTAHRMLDGIKHRALSKSGKRTVNHWRMEDSVMDQQLYKAVHTRHPCTVWSMETKANYDWHYAHFIALCEEYTHRYNKQHMTQNKLQHLLKDAPANIPTGARLTPFKLAMGAAPECIDVDNPVQSYRKFYCTKRTRFSMDWTNRPTPTWYTELQN